MKQQGIITDIEDLEELIKKRELGLAIALFLEIKADISSIDMPQELVPISQVTFFNMDLIYLKRLFGLHDVILGQLADLIAVGLAENRDQDVILAAAYYSTLEKSREFEFKFISQVTIPFCAKVICQKHLEHLLKTSAAKPGLVALYEEALTFIQDCTARFIEPIMPLVSKSATMQIDLLIEPILQNVLSGLSIIFSPALPDAFQHAYIASHRFLGQIEEHLVGCSVADLRATTVWKSFIKSWQVNIYYQLRFRDLANLIEDSLDIQLPQVSFTKPGPNMALDQIYQYKMLKKGIQDLWSDTVLIPPLFTKFFRLTLQTFARYIDWLVSIPAEFDGTQLGLSTAIVKAAQMADMDQLLTDVMESNILPFVEEQGAPRDVLVCSLDKFVASKLADGRAYLDERLCKSFSLYVTRSYQEQFKQKQVSVATTIGIVVQNLLKFSSIEAEVILPDMFALFASSARQMYESSHKTATNIRRLESVVKAQVSTEDLSRLHDHEKLKEYLSSELESLMALAKENELDAGALRELRGLII